VLYPYICRACGYSCEVRLSIEEYKKSNVVCSECGESMVRAWSKKDGNKPVSIETKGRGFEKQGFTY